MTNQTDKVTSTGSEQILTAVRLGWLTVEVFSRLRRAVQSSYKPEPQSGDVNRRFSFSDRSLNEYNALLLAKDQLEYTLTKLALSIPTHPLPKGEEWERLLTGQADLNELQSKLDDWGTKVWMVLSTENELTGRAFTYGGSLADTYWQTTILEPKGAAELLRSQRLEYIAARFDNIANYLPLYTAQVLHHTLYKWRIQKEIEQMNASEIKPYLKRLESQTKVWRDLLFGSRSADSYLLTKDYRFIAMGAFGATLILGVIVAVVSWFSVLYLSSAGRNVAASMIGLPQEIAKAQSDFILNVLDWQKWSTLLATLSAIVALLTGLVMRLSGWGIGFHHLAKKWLKLQFIYYRTYRY
jgi:hypothetical protein